MKSSYYFLFYCGVVVFSVGCTRAVALQDLFTRPEYIANGDGWAEARRRRAIEMFLQRQHHSVSIRQFDLPHLPANSKYKGTVLAVAGEGSAAPLVVTYALYFHGTSAKHEYQNRQVECDRTLAAALASLAELLQRHRQVDFAMTDSCLRLTASPRGEI